MIKIQFDSSGLLNFVTQTKKNNKDFVEGYLEFLKNLTTF